MIEATDRAADGIPSANRRGAFLRRHLLPLSTLALLVLVQYASLALDNRILVGYDTLTYFYPNEQYAAATLAAGKLPLWNPYLFTGVPFLANVQTAVLYPLNLIFLLLPAPRAYAFSIILHVFLAGGFTYVFALKAVRLRRLAALAFAIVFALSGFVGAQSGHLNQLQASSWLPAVLLAADLTYRTRSPRAAILGSLAVALQFLAGHMQEFYYSCIAIALLLSWRLYQDVRLLRRRRERTDSPTAVLPRARGISPVFQGVAFIFAMLVLACALVAIQFLPTYELSKESIRAGGMSYQEATSFSLPPWLLLRSLLPAHGDPQPFSEWIGYIGVAPLLLAIFALGRRRRHPMTPFFALLALVGIALALGQFDPIYPLVHRLVPGLNLFRVPARWLLLFTFGMAGLTGIGLQELSALAASRRQMILATVRSALALLVAGAALLALALGLNPKGPPELPGAGTVALWLAAVSATICLTLFFQRQRSRALAGAIVLLVAVELVAAGRGLDAAQVNLPEAVSSLRPSVAHLAADKGIFRVLPFSEGTFDPGDLAELKTMLGSALRSRGVYDYVVATKHKETLTPNLPLYFRIPSLDGYDGGVLPLRSYVEVKNAFGLAKPGVADGRLREELASVPPVNLLSYLNVKYVLMDRVRDAWVDGVYYDLGLTRVIPVGASWGTAPPPDLESTSIGIISHMRQAQSLPDGAAVATIEVTMDSGTVLTSTLRAGIDTSEGRYAPAAGPTPRHKQARRAKAWRDEPDAWDYVTLVRLPASGVVRSLRLVPLTDVGEFALRGVSVVDDRREMSYPVPIDPAFRISHLGDVKIYENLRVLPRAFLVHDVLTLPDENGVLSAMKEPGFDPTIQAIVSAPLDAPPEQDSSSTSPGDRVALMRYEAENVVVTAESARGGLLVLTDSHYPGWQVTVDGRPGKLVRVNHLFRGVALPPGKHEVEFRYEPESLRLGGLISLAAAIVVLGGLIATIRQRR